MKAWIFVFMMLQSASWAADNKVKSIQITSIIGEKVSTFVISKKDKSVELTFSNSDGRKSVKPLTLQSYNFLLAEIKSASQGRQPASSDCPRKQVFVISKELTRKEASYCLTKKNAQSKTWIELLNTLATAI